MLASMINEIVDRKLARLAVVTARGVVTSTDPLRVMFAGDTDPAGQRVYARATGYVPVVGDEVQLLKTDAVWSVWGAVSEPSSTTGPIQTRGIVVDTDPLTVMVDSVFYPAARHAGYTAVLNHDVDVYRDRWGWVVRDRIIT